ncbi:helix-turn-helix transcriptional regulator [Streptomyces sp. NPDC059835]|uniref:helix-turn-helix transcriptional regulator n=1 Tax=Streptomyces sp. NPDC059835 TaxID=3346967 RepID=UPI0036576ADA
MDRDWKRLGRAIKEQRDHLGMATQQDLADEAGVTRQTVQSLEAGKPRTRMPATISKIEKALGWEAGTAARILTGTGSDDTTTPRFAEGMPLRVAQELSDGQVVDTEVLDLSVPGSNSRLVVVFKQDAEAAAMSPDELRAATREWTRIQRAIRQIAASDDAEQA